MANLKRVLAEETLKQKGKKVRVEGWASNIRDHGQLLFIDLRDWSGVVQVVIRPEDKEQFEVAKAVGVEDVISVVGSVEERDKELVNDKIPTGKIEVVVQEIEIVNKTKHVPFPLSDDGREIDENVRLKYRFIDLRRKRLRDMLKKRHKRR